MESHGQAQLNPSSMSVLAFIHVELQGTKRQIPAPVATFGSHKPAMHASALVHVQPATAFPLIQNASALRGKIAIVQRGDCSFAAKAKSVQAAGAIGMILTNSNEELVRMGEAFEKEGAGIEIPVLMVGQSLGKSLQNDMRVVIHIKHEPKSLLQAGVDAVKKTVEQTGEVMQAGVEVVKKSVEVYTKDPEIVHITPETMESIVKPKPSSDIKSKPPQTPLFAFVLYATNAESYHVQFAPLADFGLSRKKLYFRSRLVFANPLHAFPSLTNKSALGGSIAFVERGGCTFPEKIDRLQQAGAIAVIMANNDTANPDAAFVMSVDQFNVDHITIPSVMLPYNVSKSIQAQPPDTIGIVCLEGSAAGVLLSQETSVYSLWSPPPSTSLPPLLQAARNGSMSSLTSLLQTTSPNVVDAYNASTLHHASIAGSVECVEILLAAGAHVDALDLGSQTPLHYACMVPSVTCVQALINAAAHTLAVNEGGSTPLHVACFAGSTECMELLLTATATMDAAGKYMFHGVNEVDKSGRTPLHVACRYGHGDCAMYLMAASAEVNFVDHKGWTPLHYACERLNTGENIKADLHVIEQLLRYGARMQDSKAAADGSLILDRIRSNALRREVEILYLRQEVAAHRADASQSQRQLACMQATIQQAVTDAKNEAAKVTAQLEETISKQQLTIQHMQCQLTSILQCLQRGNGLSVAQTPVEMTSSGVENVETDMDRAQEAALARDLGRKCMRSKQYALAKTYFESSLQWYVLPGVRKLLEQVDRILLSSAASTATPCVTKLIEQYRTKLRTAGASKDVMETIEAELNALKHVDPSSTQFTMIQEWLEWLVGLPWTEQLPCSYDLFVRVNEVQSDEALSKQHRAARVIQRIVREHLASLKFHKDWAATVIQSAFRGHKSRRRQTTAPSKCEVNPAEAVEVVVLRNPVDECVDLSVTVDTPAAGKLGSAASSCVVLRGTYLEQDKTAKFYILQWIQVSDGRHFIWTRWGGRDESASALKGPYESSADAQREFDKLYKHKTQCTWGKEDTMLVAQTPWTYHPTRRRCNVEVA